MNETEFLRGIEGEEQNGTDLVSGAEHLVRLKIQSGQQTEPKYEDLELEKKASLKDTAKTVLEGAKSGLKYQGFGASVGVAGMKADKARAAGHLLGMAAPAAAVGAVGYGLGHHAGHRAGVEKDSCTKMAAAETLKTALRDKLAAPADWNKSMLAATTGLGALAGGLGTFLASRAQKDTGKSKMEENLGASVEANKSKPERGFLQKIKNRETESAHGFARAFREHPVKASLLGTLTGAAGGYGIGQLGGAIARRGGK